MFHRFQSRIVIRGVLLSQGPVRVGAGRDSAVNAPDLAVVRDVAGQPYIPGSSMKGVLRSYTESIVRAAAGAEAACDPSDTARACIKPGAGKSGSPGISLRELTDKFSGEELARQIEKHSCLVCPVFGSHAMAAHVSFDDLNVMEWYGQFQVRNGVSINRDSGRAEDTRLYDFEVVPAGTRFHFRAVLENCEPWKRGLVAMGIHALQDRYITIGGGRSRGLGQVSLEEVEYCAVDNADELLQTLDGSLPRDGAAVALEAVGEWIRALREKLKEGSHVQATR